MVGGVAAEILKFCAKLNPWKHQFSIYILS